MHQLLYGLSSGKNPNLGGTPTLEVAMVIFYQPNPDLSRGLK